MSIDVRAITVEDLPYLKEGDAVLVGCYEYVILGEPVPFGVLGDVSVPAKRKNCTMPSGYELATLTPYAFC